MPLNRIRLAAFAGFVGAGILAAAPASAQVTNAFSFNPTQGGAMNSIGFDPVADEVFVHFDSSTSVHVYTRTGTFVRTITKPTAPTGGVADDLEFVEESVTINGTVVPTNSLIVFENDNDPPRIVAANKATGTPALATKNFNASTIGGWVGGAYHHDRNTFYAADFAQDNIRELNASAAGGDGVIVNTFSATPAGQSTWNFSFGDVEASRQNNNLYLVSDVHDNTIRVLSPTGAFVANLTVTGGLPDPAGIALDDQRGEIWISSRDGNVYRLTGLTPIPEPAALGLLLAAGIPVMLRRPRSR
jgi:hypothetical protein